jgi:chemotaxis protein CheX
MDAKYINPFISATVSALEMMAGLSPERGTPFIQEKFESLADMSGIIGFAGDLKGAVVLCFPIELANHIYCSLTGEEDPTPDPSEVGDAIGELANMVVGGAKAPLSEMGLSIQLSIPSVVSGKNHMIMNKSSGPCLVIPFKLEGRDFWVQVNMKTP